LRDVVRGQVADGRVVLCTGRGRERPYQPYGARRRSLPGLSRRRVSGIPE
jgi:hypothetical protein